MRALWALLLLSGCGYGFAVGGPAWPANVGKVYVPVFANRSDEPDAGALFAEAMAASLSGVGRAGTAGEAASIEGEVLGVTWGPLTTGPDGSGVGLYQITARVRLKLVQGGQVLCRRELSGLEDFLPARDLTGLEALRRTALRRLARRMMVDAEYKLCPKIG